MEARHGARDYKNSVRSVLPGLLVFGLMLLSTSASAQSADDGSTVLDGQVVLGPIAPVSMPGVPDNRPYAATLSIQMPDATQEITQVTTDDQGVFSVALDPGSYLVVPLSPPGQSLPFGKPQTVTLDAGTVTTIVVQYDSGIR